MGKLDDLERLHKLKESGSLTEEEFNLEKKKILSKEYTIDNTCESNNLINSSNIKNDNVLIEEEYSETKLESVSSIIVIFIGYTIALEICGFIIFPHPATLGLVFGICIGSMILCLISRASVGKCPYCSTVVKTKSKTGFVCPTCRKNIAVKDNRFLKIKN